MNFLIKGVLIMVYILIATPLRIIFKITRIGGIELEKGTKYIIAANHPSKLDPFLILAALPFRTYLRLIPTRFVTSEEYLRNWRYKIFLVPLGCISNKPKNGKKTLELMKERIMSKETIFIFPRGELEKKGIISKPKIGAIYLEREIKDCKIIPVKLTFSEKLSFSNVLKRKVKTDIKFKKIFRHNKLKDDLQKYADNLMEIIENNGK